MIVCRIMSDTDTSRYANAYSEGRLWEKLGRYAAAAGRELVEKAVLLYLVLRDPGTPKWAKATVIGALGYFIAPIDAIPDLIPGVGFTDDLGVLAVALGVVAASITPHMRQSARRVVERWRRSPDEFDGEGPVIEVEATVVSREPTIRP